MTVKDLTTLINELYIQHWEKYYSLSMPFRQQVETMNGIVQDIFFLIKDNHSPDNTEIIHTKLEELKIRSHILKNLAQQIEKTNAA